MLNTVSSRREWYLWGSAFLFSLVLLGSGGWQWYQISLQQLIPATPFSHDSTMPISEHIEIFSPEMVPSYTAKLILSGMVHSDQSAHSYVVIKEGVGQHNYREGDALVDMPKLKVHKIRLEGVEIQTPRGVEVLMPSKPVYTR